MKIAISHQILWESTLERKCTLWTLLVPAFRAKVLHGPQRYPVANLQKNQLDQSKPIQTIKHSKNPRKNKFDQKNQFYRLLRKITN